MHATYCFLIPIPVNGVDDYPAHAMSLFKEFIDDTGDDDNGYQQQALILPDGRCWPLCPIDDWRARYIPQQRIQEASPENRYNEAKKFAYRCALSEMNFGRLDPDEEDLTESLSIQEIDLKIRTEMPKEIIKHYRKLIANCLSNDQDSLAGWKRKKLTSRFELFIASEKPPFTKICNGGPLSYRCFDLEDYTPHDLRTEEDAILLVDIHT